MTKEITMFEIIKFLSVWFNNKGCWKIFNGKYTMV